MYYAHINGDKFQTIEDHCKNVARIATENSLLEFSKIIETICLLHDIGKYQEMFQKRLRDSRIRVEHSIYGAIEAKCFFVNKVDKLVAEYCIAGHHGGLPNGGAPNAPSTDSSLFGRLKRKSADDYSSYKNELEIGKVKEDIIFSYLKKHAENKEEAIELLAFIIRYVFSCLKDADIIDTQLFFQQDASSEVESNFVECLRKIDNVLGCFKPKTSLQNARAVLQKQAFENAIKDGDVYLLNMPTGSGKTLASMKIALSKAIDTNKKRIIYVIPYNSIIDQTVQVFEDAFGDSAKILRHQSTYLYDDDDGELEANKKKRLACENWDASIIITTAVQFFESIYSNKTSKLRKLHNMANSIIVFDEVHLLPINYMEPCIKAITFIAKVLESKALFLTATMPNFKTLIDKFGIKNTKVIDLVDTKKADNIFKSFEKCKFENLGDIGIEKLVQNAQEKSSALIVVNKKETALKIYNMLSTNKYHLSTYMITKDRAATIADIKSELEKLKTEYPNQELVPHDRRIIVVSTSLIEAGVDLDFESVYREINGLHNILQSAGRCNREGLKKDAVSYIFEIDKANSKSATSIEAGITKGILKEFENINTPDCVLEFYNRLHKVYEASMSINSISKMQNSIATIESIPFKDYARQFELIDSKTISIIVPIDDAAKGYVEELKKGNYKCKRKLNEYSATININEFKDLLQQGAVDDYKSGIYVLTNKDYYDKKTGIQFQGKDLIT